MHVILIWKLIIKLLEIILNIYVKNLLFYKISRYYIKCKKYLNSDEKYYLSDHAFRYVRLGTKFLDYGRVYENIVAIELIRGGYKVYTGILYNKEVDLYDILLIE